MQELYLMLESYDTSWQLKESGTGHQSRPIRYDPTIGLIPFKAFYEYWEANGGTKLNDGLFQFISGLTNSDNCTEQGKSTSLQRNL